MNRRYAIRQILAVSAGMMIIPSCMEDRTKASFLLKNYQISSEQEKMLAELAEMIIPKTTTPGAKDVYAHQFAMKMIDDCESRDDQQKFVQGLEAFEKYVEKRTGSSFLEATTQQRSGVLEDMEKMGTGDPEEASFYRKMKGLTIRAYSTSQFYLTQVQVYEMIPGRWHGCVPVKQSA